MPRKYHAAVFDQRYYLWFEHGWCCPQNWTKTANHGEGNYGPYSDVFVVSLHSTSRHVGDRACPAPRDAAPVAPPTRSALTPSPLSSSSPSSMRSCNTTSAINTSAVRACVNQSMQPTHTSGTRSCEKSVQTVACPQASLFDNTP